MLSHEQHKLHSCPQKPRSFWSVREITTSGLVQRHSDFEWLCKHNRLRPEPNRFVRLDSEHAQSDCKSVNHGLLVLDLARGRNLRHWPKGSRPLGTRMSNTTVGHDGIQQPYVARWSSAWFSCTSGKLFNLVSGTTAHEIMMFHPKNPRGVDDIVT